MSLPKVPQRTTPGLAFSMVEPARFDCLGARQFSKPEIGQDHDYFNIKDQPEGVYCGSAEVKRWDQLVPINGQGGQRLETIGELTGPFASRPWLDQ